MKRNILNEIGEMKYLLGYKRGVVISEQAPPVVAQDDDNNLNPKIVAGTTPAASTTPEVKTPDTTTPPPAVATPIKIGVKYPSIVELQNSLNTKFQAGLTADGKYGPKTSLSILTALQNLNKVSTPVDGDKSQERANNVDVANKTAAAASTTQVDDKSKVQSGPANAGFSETKFEDFYV
jgi:hypothetical protein